MVSLSPHSHSKSLRPSKYQSSSRPRNTSLSPHSPSSVIRPEEVTKRSGAGTPRSGEGCSLTALAFNYDALGAPSVECVHLHSLHLVARFDTLNNLRHRLAGPLLPPAPFLFRCSSPQAVVDMPET